MGQRYRFTTADGRKVSGAYVSTDEGVLRLRNEDGTLVLDGGRVTRVEVSTGEHNNIGRGIGYGVAGGALVGLVAFSTDDATSYYGDLNAGEGMLLGAVSGAMWGLLLGAIIRTEGWQEIGDGSGALASLRVTPSGRGIGIGAAIPVR